MAFEQKAYQLPLFSPESSWVAPQPIDWPDLRGRAKIIGVDTETDDPNLGTKGPGFIRGDARLCGVSLASEDGVKLYLPINHSEGNLDKDQVLRYVKHQLGGSQPKAGANLMYDLESLWSAGVEVEGPLADIQIAGPLLDEDRKDGYSLDSLSRHYLGVGKSEDLLDEAANCYGLPAKKAMGILPAKFVGPYAEDDAWFAIQIFQKQERELIKDEVYHIFELERKLQKILFKMRLKGVRIDLDLADQWSTRIQKRERQLMEAIATIAGRRVNPGSAKSLAPILEKRGLTVPFTYTKAGNISYNIDGDWLKAQKDPLCNLVAKWRKSNKMRSDFIDTLLHDNVNGRIHSNWQQLRDYDENGKSKGTRSGRIAANRFNLTQVPSRDPFWGPMIRSMFIADEGGFWGKADFSQQEPRIGIHFAYLMSKTQMGRGRYDGIEDAMQRYRDNPRTDYHTMTQMLILERTNTDIGRPKAKGINLGAAYGMGKYKLAIQLEIELEEAEEVLRSYHAGVPYIKDLGEDCMKIVQERGYIKTILGRKRRFKSWEPANWEARKSARPTEDREEAIRLWGYVQRAFAHKAMNATIQGSAADQMKKAIVDLYEQHNILPQVQVYDELNTTLYEPDQLRVLKKTMEEAIVMEVPFIADPDWGPSWGQVKEFQL